MKEVVKIHNLVAENACACGEVILLERNRVDGRWMCQGSREVGGIYHMRASCRPEQEVLNGPIPTERRSQPRTDSLVEAFGEMPRRDPGSW